jgi:hypothetical protein
MFQDFIMFKAAAATAATATPAIHDRKSRIRFPPVPSL